VEPGYRGGTACPVAQDSIWSMRRPLRGRISFHNQDGNEAAGEQRTDSMEECGREPDSAAAEVNV